MLTLAHPHPYADEDELVNVQLAEQARLEENLAVKKKGAVAYRAYDDEELGPDGRTLLSLPLCF